MKTKILKFILIFIVAFTVLAEVLYLFCVPFFLNKYIQSGDLKKLVKSQTGLVLEADSIKVSTAPDFSLKIKSKNLNLETENSEKILTYNSLFLKVFLPSLVVRHLTITQANIENLNVIIARHNGSGFCIGSYELNNALKLDTTALRRFRGKIIGSKIEIRDYKLNQNTVLNLDEIAVNDYKRNKRLNASAKINVATGQNTADLNLYIDSKLPIQKHMDALDLKGCMGNFNLAPYSDYASEFIKHDIKSLSGVFDADFVFKKHLNLTGKIKDFAVVMENEQDSLYADGLINIDFSGNAQKENIDINSLKLQGNSWRFDISGILKNIKSKNPDLDLTVKIPDADIHTLIRMLPAIENSNHAVEKLKRYGAWGRMRGELKINGDAKQPLVYGKSHINNLHILKEDPIVAPCEMDLDFRGKDVYLYTKVFADKKKQQYVEIEGTSELKPFGAGEIKIKSTDSVDLKTAHYMLVPIHDIVGFDLGPLPYMSISGRGNIELLTRGTVFDGEAFGKFRFENTDAVFKGLHTRIENAGGYLDFNGKDMLFVMDKAKIKGCHASIKGKANLNGNIDFKIEAPAIHTDELISIVNNSALLESKKAFTERIKKMEGRANVLIELKGVVKKFADLRDVSDLDFSGQAVLSDNTLYIGTLPPVRKISGKIKFDNDNLSSDVQANAFQSNILVQAKVKNNKKADVKLLSDKLNVDELISYVLSQNPETISGKAFVPKTHAYMTLKASYHGHPFKINYNNIDALGHILPPKSHNKQDLFIKTGSFTLKNNTFRLKDLNTAVFDTIAKADLEARNVFSAAPRFSGNLGVLNFNISNFNKIRNMKMLPPGLQKALRAYENYEGSADMRITCSNNKVNGQIRLLNIKFLQSAFKIPITVDSGNIDINNNKITFKSINANFDNVPIFINASLDGISENAKIDGYVTTKVTEAFVNKYINDRLSYPLKPKGDITLTAELSGPLQRLRIQPKLRLEKDADIYYMGANLDDIDEEREINADITVKKNTITINSLNYLRYMTSQNDFTYPRRIISIRGNVHQKKDKFILDNLRIATENNANVKLFNVLFKKSVLKKGMFNCNLTLNGDAGAPVVLGKAGMIDLDMPLYTTLIKDVSLRFTPSHVYASMNGLSYDSDFVMKTSIRNKLSMPVVIEDLNISSKSVEMDNILDSLTQVTLNTGIKLEDGSESDNEKKQPDVSSLIIKNGTIEAEKMQIRGLPAEHFKAGIKLDKDMVLKVEDLKFDIAQGVVSGLAKYDFKTGKISAEVTAKHVDANMIATALFEAKDQIFGYLNGSMFFSTRGNTEAERLGNISGSVYFEINDGKMPKLGSVEYLLKASSLFKSGITGVSLNNFIDLIAPIKTGYFNSIRGLLLISRGKAKNVEIFSTGDNLSMYIKGTYDIPESFADLNVYGRLTKKADNILGPVGNLSFNSLLNLIPGFKLDRKNKALLVKELNKIPGVEFNDMRYRIFNAKINGDINSDKYVKYFKWIE